MELLNMSNSFSLTMHDQLRVGICEMAYLFDETFSARIEFFALRCMFRMFRTFIFLKNGVENFDEIESLFEKTVKACYSKVSTDHPYFLSLVSMYSEAEKHLNEKRLIFNVRSEKKLISLSTLQIGDLSLNEDGFTEDELLMGDEHSSVSSCGFSP